MKKGSIVFTLTIWMLAMILSIIHVVDAEIMNYYGGEIGQDLYFRIDVPHEVKVGKEFSVTVSIEAQNPIHINFVTVTFGGAGIKWKEDIAKDIDMKLNDRITKTFALTPTYENNIGCEIYADYLSPYTLKYRENCGRLTLDITRSTTVTSEEHTYIENELRSQIIVLKSENTMLTILFAVVSVSLVGSTIYFAKRKPKTT